MTKPIEAFGMEFVGLGDAGTRVKVQPLSPSRPRPNHENERPGKCPPRVHPLVRPPGSTKAVEGLRPVQYRAQALAA
jgi:hypothetical protein